MREFFSIMVFILFIMLVTTYHEKYQEKELAEIESAIKTEAKAERESLEAQAKACPAPAGEFADVAIQYFINEIELQNPELDVSTYSKDVKLISCKEDTSNVYLYYIDLRGTTSEVKMKYVTESISGPHIEPHSITVLQDNS